MNCVCKTCRTPLQDKGFCPRCDQPQKTLVPDHTKKVVSKTTVQHRNDLPSINSEDHGVANVCVVQKFARVQPDYMKKNSEAPEADLEP